MSKKKGKSTKKETKTKEKNEKESEKVKENSNSEESSPIEEGDFVLIDIVGRIKKTNDVFITTIKEIAEKEEIYDDQLLYEPHLVIIGDNFTIQGLSIQGVSQKLMGMNIGDTETFTIPPKEAFGERSAKKIKTYSMKNVKKVEKSPRIGKRIVIDNQSGYISRIDRGRVKIDFNHPYAGLEILYEVTVKEKIMEEDKKLNTLIQSRIPIKDPGKIEIKREETALSLIIPGDIAFQLARHLPMIKLGLSMDIQRNFGVDTVKFVEVFGKHIFGGAMPPQHDHEHDHGEEEEKEDTLESE
jgi:FKBP-type peptidyl-prolyl cis-trans isomerase 2